MKSIFFLTLIILNPWSIYGQLEIDAGKDTNFCFMVEPYELGGNPTAINGTEPYTYIWTLNYFGESGHYPYASEFLNDTSISNPIFTNAYTYGKFIFHLMVIDDDDDSIKEDSIIIWNSSIKEITMVNLGQNIVQGDSAQLCPCNVIYGIPPFSYEWYPEYGLSDPNIAIPFAKPDTSVVYHVIVTDSIGCFVQDEYDVFVIPISNIEDIDKNSFIRIFPNPITENSKLEFLNPEHEFITVEIYNSTGIKLHSFETNKNVFDIGNYIGNSGVFFIYLVKNNEIIYTEKVVKE